MTTLHAKQLIGLVKKNVAGNAESYCRAKYVTRYGKNIFEVKSQNGREWFISINLLESDRWAYIQTQAVSMGIFNYTESDNAKS